ncbi:hypothetical protein BT93_I0461 [Corymbia citriodora subsp. variegata]|nr:hypothetical protein BT93_I0461 [Corymbia citriodora subsp. variegata]
MGIVEEAHNVRVLGSGDETIVLAHGFGTDQSVWKHLVPHLVGSYRVVLYDNMGAGTTNPDYFDFERYSSLEGFAYDLLAILEELGIWLYLSNLNKFYIVSSYSWYLNDPEYYGGFEQADLDQLFEAMRENYKAWCSGFAPLAIGGDMDTVYVQEFSRTLFNMRPDVALCVAQTIFQIDMRPYLGLVTVPCHIIQSVKDLAVPVGVSEYLHQHLGGNSSVEVMSTDGHLPQLSSPEMVVPVLLRHIHGNVAA